MGRMIPIYNAEAVEPPEITPVMECPVCGADLYEGDRIYYTTDKGHVNVWACTHCLHGTFVEDF